ncbi:MAG: malto-oligosyltrehalose synthase [Nitrospirota bacterium]|nr:malto-oligosyltrehalose synthase [Nitrospirota bacterium]
MRHPISTYRLQFTPSFSFRDATRIIPYLHSLGITDCYTSPYLKASPGSSHGYDVVDPTQLNPELGTPEDYQAFVETLSSHNMGQVLDIVPNHMSIAGPWNTWWQDILENGPSSQFADFFDINWHPVKAELHNKVLLPILGDQYGVVLENGEITLSHQEGQFFIHYYENSLPVDPSSWIIILQHRIETLVASNDPSDPHVQELQSIITALINLPSRNDSNAESITERSREKEVIKRRLSTLIQDSPLIADFLQANLQQFNGEKENPQTFDLLDELLSAQVYRLAFWQVASEEINYRRFFDINDLAAIRIEEATVFQTVHQFIFSLIESGSVSGLRIDHVDGLYDPRAYLQNWQTWAQHALQIRADDKGRALFIVVEKILGRGETLSNDWPVHGTTGYEFLSLLNNLFIDSSSKRILDSFYMRFTHNDDSVDEQVYECKAIIADSSMASELNTLGHQLNRLSEKYRRSRDFTLHSLIHALHEIIACFPVYRTYVTPDPDEPITDRDRAYIRLAVTQAKRKNPTTNAQVFDFIQDFLLKTPTEGSPLTWATVHPFVMRFQQLTSPVMAKGVEDTAFYRYNRLVSLNDVGGEPSQFGIPMPVFHERMRDRQQHWPRSLSATSTHDTKRSEDVRARINVLSEIPKEWKASVSRWHRLNRKKRVRVDDLYVPSRNEEYLLYQTLVGAWPFAALDSPDYVDFIQRIQEYMLKALREAKIHSSWISPHEAYERAMSTFVTKILSPILPHPFLDDFLQFQTKISAYGMYNSLAQVVIKTTAPGIPDFYQGTELWDFTLVDPDNRRPVDYSQRIAMIEELKPFDIQPSGGFLEDLLASYTDGRIKLYLTQRLLHYRRTHSTLFLQGSYDPLETLGTRQHHLCAYQRAWEGKSVISLAPRLIHQLLPDPSKHALGKAVWDDTMVVLPQSDRGTTYLNILTNAPVNSILVNQQPMIPVAEIFTDLPVALMEPLP